MLPHAGVITPSTHCFTPPDASENAHTPQEKKKSLDEVDPELLKTFAKLGIPLNEQKRLSNVAVDAVFDSVSIATTFRCLLACIPCMLACMLPCMLPYMRAALHACLHVS